MNTQRQAFVVFKSRIVMGKLTNIDFEHQRRYQGHLSSLFATHRIADT